MIEKKLKVSCANGQTALHIQMAPYDTSRFKMTEVPFELVEYKGGRFKIRSAEGGYGIADIGGKVIVEPVWADTDILCGADGKAQAFAAKTNVGETAYGDHVWDMCLLTTDGEVVADIYGVKWAGANEGLAVVYQDNAEYGSGFWMQGGVCCFDLKEKKQRFCYLDDYFKKRDWREVFHDGLLRVPYKDSDGSVNSSYSTFLDKNGEEVHSYVLGATHSSEGKIVAGVQRLFRADQYGMFDSATTQSNLKGRYDSMKPYCNGYAVVEKKKQYGFVDKDFKVSAELEWDRLGDLHSDGLAFAQKNGECMLIDCTGKVKVKLPAYTDGYCGYSEDSYLLKRNGLFVTHKLVDARKRSIALPELTAFVDDCRNMHRGLTPMLVSREDGASVWNVYDCAGNAVLDADDSFQPADTGLGFTGHAIYDYGWKRPAYFRRRLPSFKKWGNQLFERVDFEAHRSFGTVFEPFRIGQWLSGDSEIVGNELKDYFADLETNGLKRDKAWRLDDSGSEILFFRARDREGLSALQVTVDGRTVVDCDFMAIVVREGEETRFRFAASREFVFQ